MLLAPTSIALASAALEKPARHVFAALLGWLIVLPFTMVGGCCPTPWAQIPWLEYVMCWPAVWLRIGPRRLGRFQLPALMAGLSIFSGGGTGWLAFNVLALTASLCRQIYPGRVARAFRRAAFLAALAPALEAGSYDCLIELGRASLVLWPLWADGDEEQRAAPASGLPGVQRWPR